MKILTDFWHYWQDLTITLISRHLFWAIIIGLLLNFSCDYLYNYHRYHRFGETDVMLVNADADHQEYQLCGYKISIAKMP